MQIKSRDIYFPDRCSKALTGRLHFIENPKLCKRAVRIGPLTLDYEQVMEIQKELVLNLAQSENPNPVLMEAISGERTLTETLEELSVVDKPPRRWLPRKKDEKWNKRCYDLQELIGITYYEKPRFKKPDDKFCDIDESFKPNYSIITNLSSRGILNPVNPASCGAYVSGFNALLGLGVDMITRTTATQDFIKTNSEVYSFLTSFPVFATAGIIVGGAFGAALGFITQESGRGILPFEEAKYLDWKLDELELKTSN